MQKWNVWLVVVAMTAALGGFATDCNTDCEGHFDSPWQRPDLIRCKAERAAACRTGLTTCDVWKVNPGTSANFYGAIEAITLANRQTGQPQTASACHSAVNMAASGAGAAGFAYKVVSEGARAAMTLSRASVISFVISEGVKHFAHCACTNARYQNNGGGGQPTGQRVGLDLNYYCKRQYGSFSNAVLRNRASVSGWSCTGRQGEMLAMDLRQACIWQHGTAQVGYTNPNDAFSWYCQK